MVIKNFGFDDDLLDDEFQQNFATKQNISPVVSEEEAKRETETEILEEQLEFDFDYDTYGGGSENFGKN